MRIGDLTMNKWGFDGKNMGTYYGYVYVYIYIDLFIITITNNMIYKMDVCLKMVKKIPPNGHTPDGCNEDIMGTTYNGDNMGYITINYDIWVSV